MERLTTAWHKALATKTWSRMVAGAFRCFEVKPGKDGRWNVHAHAVILLWAPGVPYEVLRGVWNRAAESEGLELNQRFDQLRQKVKARKGGSKAAAVASYLVKYLVK